PRAGTTASMTSPNAERTAHASSAMRGEDQYLESSPVMNPANSEAESAEAIDGRIGGVLKSREIRASALRWIPAEFSGAKSTKKRYVGFPSIAAKSTPRFERPNAARRLGTPGSLP